MKFNHTALLRAGAPLLLGILAHSLSVREVRWAQSQAAPLRPEIWEALLLSRGYLPDRRNAGGLLAAEVSEADVWAWPEENRIQIGEHIYAHKDRRSGQPSPSTPLHLGSGWTALSAWAALSHTPPAAPTPPLSRPRRRIWY